MTDLSSSAGSSSFASPATILSPRRRYNENNVSQKLTADDRRYASGIVNLYADHRTGVRSSLKERSASVSLPDGD